MENCFWPKEYDSWNYTQSEATAAAAALQYHFYHPATGAPWASPFEGVACASTPITTRSHSEAEKRRRDRINAQLAALRKLIPKSEKMDKASLLGRVVDHVKEQSKLVNEVSKSSAIPTETDEVIISVHSNNNDVPSSSTGDNQEDVYLKASICCDDRTELFAEINGAVKGLGLTMYQAEITSIGGRMKSSLVLCAKSDGKNTSAESLKQSLKLALSRVVITYGSSNYTARSKRQRFFYPNYR